ncbi:MAG: CheR family methyltransferase [Caulobacteraceae bacterium]
MTRRQPSFPIVGVGASAGGVEALEGLFRNVPADVGCAFVVITHLNPERPSLLPEVLARFTGMPVHGAEDAAALKPNEIHVLPADALLEIEDGRLRVRKAASGRGARKPIDVFFGALALDQGEYAVGIVLSGGDGDGTLGVKAIKERGGLTLAQVADGHGPQHPQMPASAIASGMVDLAIPVDEMGARLAEFARDFDLLDRPTREGRASGERALNAARREICAILRGQVGHDFSGYKERTFMRRVQRRMQVNRLDTLEAYVERLRGDAKEVGALFRDLLINVTTFFRDPEAFEVLQRQVIPKLFADREPDDAIRAWVPGCATGEEVYSVAILMREQAETLASAPRVQIFATDIDEAALGVARAGRYPAALLESVSAERKQRFFTHDDGSYLLNKDVRDLCVFSPHSVIRDPPFSRLDLISCRNLLIYLAPDAQDQVIPTFHYALRPGGYLFLGGSENVTQFSDLFTPVDKKHRVFRGREDVAARASLIMGAAKPAPFAPTPGKRPRGLGGMSLRQAVELNVLERYAPAHLVVNRDGDVVYYSARTGKYLEATAGAPSRQLLAMARKGLRLDLRQVLREAIEGGRRVTREGATVETDNGRIQKVSVTAEPLGGLRDDERLLLVVFADVGAALSEEDAASRASSSEDTAIELDRELRETRERLQSLIEEYETALEELKSSNEELVSVNEELQSSNEELEASKEELQSLNEELHTVNAELNDKVEQLDRANSDLTNLFESTRVATVFLDRDLVIRNFTPAASQVFNILASDRGRPLTDLVSRVPLPTLTKDVDTVFANGRTVERAIEHDAGATHYLLRLVPYRGADNTIEGVVLTFVDVTTLTRAEAHQKVLIAELNHRVKNMLTVVISIAEQTFKGPGDPATFKDRFIARVRGMARSYELLSRENWTEASVAELARPQVEPFGLERVALRGPDIRLAPKQALSFGMIMHELATNAGKYGALSTPEGRVELRWGPRRGANGGEVEVLWRERDGPSAGQPGPRGFGLRLIEREAVNALGGEAEFSFEPEGFSVRLMLPTGGPARDSKA